MLMLPLGITIPLHAQTQWQSIDAGTEEATQASPWEAVPIEDSSNKDMIWEPLSPEEEELEPDELVWTEPTIKQITSENETGNTLESDEQPIDKTDTLQEPNKDTAFRWPNGQLMSEADQIYYRSAWSRGSMVQIGDTVYPNIGMNALQRALEVGLNWGLQRSTIRGNGLARQQAR